MNSEFRVLFKTENTMKIRIMGLFAGNVILSIFKNRYDFMLSMLSIINAIFFLIYDLMLKNDSLSNLLFFPNLYVLSIAGVFADLVKSILAFVLLGFGLSKVQNKDSQFYLFIVICFLSAVINGCLIQNIFSYKKIKGRIFHLKSLN